MQQVVARSSRGGRAGRAARASGARARRGTAAAPASMRIEHRHGLAVGQRHDQVGTVVDVVEHGLGRHRADGALGGHAELYLAAVASRAHEVPRRWVPVGL